MPLVSQNFEYLVYEIDYSEFISTSIIIQKYLCVYIVEYDC